MLLYSVLFLTVFVSCNQSSDKNQDKKEVEKSDTLKEATNEQEVLSGEQWLKSIFQCDDNDTGYCYPNEEEVTTEQYYEFFVESLAIYEYPMFDSEDERIAAEKAYKKKWKDIYPLDDEVSYPFGRGNGTTEGDQLQSVVVTPESNNRYTLVIDYGGETKAITEVTLIANGNSYLVDYMISEYI